jgi:Activator of Hsp90 ATPase homolog 1-like protein
LSADRQISTRRPGQWCSHGSISECRAEKPFHERTNRDDRRKAHRHSCIASLRLPRRARVRRLARCREGAQVSVRNLDPRVGGAFNFTDRRDGVDAEHIGEYLEIDRPRRLVFTFHTERDSTDLSRVTIEIVPRGSGCELTLIHEIDPKWAEYKDRTEAGWTTILTAFAKVLE